MNRAYTLVIPSHDEPYGIVALEAAYAGTCVLASREGGLKSIIINHKNGILYDNKKLDDLKNRMEWIINNVEMRNKICRSIVLNSDDSIGEKMYSIYSRVIEEKNYVL